MLIWLVENAGPFFWLLGLTALALAAAGWTTRNRKIMLTLAAVVSLIAFLWLLSVLVETDEKRINRVVAEMVQGVREQKVDKIFQHVAKSFTRGGMKYDDFRNFAQQQLRHHAVGDLSASPVKLLSRQNGQAKVEFWVHIPEAGGAPIRCEADFVQEEGVWKMQGFDLFMGNTGNKWQF
jgi:hypothetical protein